MRWWEIRDPVERAKAKAASEPPYRCVGRDSFTQIDTLHYVDGRKAYRANSGGLFFFTTRCTRRVAWQQALAATAWDIQQCKKSQQRMA